jgi:three-Cys-motif partner protein
MTATSFFDESREQSEIKSRIVAKYFWAWAKVIIPSAKQNGNPIAYIDLFAGPGRYKDGTLSTPLLVLKRAIEDADMREMLVTIFNDNDIKNIRSLESEIAALPGINKLKHKPNVEHGEVGEEIVEFFTETSLIPTFFFVDPWGYKGLSLRLINSILKDWGCDCVLFFNYNRINMGLNNDAVRDHMEALFGEARANELRLRLTGMSSVDREAAILEELAKAMNEMGAKYVLPFTFKNESGSRTTHHLIFASKHFKGYEIMKEIMASESSKTTQGVPSFEYSPASRRFRLLFELSRPLDDLEDSSLGEIRGSDAQYDRDLRASQCWNALRQG